MDQGGEGAFEAVDRQECSEALLYKGFFIGWTRGGSNPCPREVPLMGFPALSNLSAPRLFSIILYCSLSSLILL